MWKTALLRGTAVAAVAALGAGALAVRGFGKTYYLAALLPAEALFFLVVSWFLHLRDDGFFKEPGRQKPRRVDLVPRQGEQEEPRERPERDRFGSRAFLAAAVELAILATALYFLAGIGASYFL